MNFKLTVKRILQSPVGADYEHQVLQMMKILSKYWKHCKLWTPSWCRTPSSSSRSSSSSLASSHSASPSSPSSSCPSCDHSSHDHSNWESNLTEDSVPCSMTYMDEDMSCRSTAKVTLQGSVRNAARWWVRGVNFLFELEIFVLDKMELLVLGWCLEYHVFIDTVVDAGN